MTERPAYRTLDIAPGQRYFDCATLRASLSTTACGQRWAAAAPGSACHQCALGRLHHADHSPSKRPGRRPMDNEVRACTRCERSDLRIIKTSCICVSCFNREAGWRKGRNGRGTPPARFTPLRDFEVVLQRSDGRIERRLLQALHPAEAIGRTMRDLPEGARFANERQLTSWNRLTGEFEVVCQNCSTAGLVLERERGGALERHSWCCAGGPPGSGWRVAPVRKPLMAMGAATAAGALNADPDLTGEPSGSWIALPYACQCGSGQLEGSLASPSGRW